MMSEIDSPVFCRNQDVFLSRKGNLVSYQPGSELPAMLETFFSCTEEENAKKIWEITKKKLGVD